MSPLGLSLLSPGVVSGNTTGTTRKFWYSGGGGVDEMRYDERVITIMVVVALFFSVPTDGWCSRNSRSSPCSSLREGGGRYICII